MKKTALLSTLILFSIICKAQHAIESVKLEKTIVSLNFLAPGLSIETAVADQQSLYFNAGLSFYYESTTINGQSSSEFSSAPYLLVQYRGYYNLDKRKLLGKKTRYNSGNYWGIMLARQGKSFQESDNLFLPSEPTTVLGPVWGIQRNGTVSFGLSLGVGLQISQSNTDAGIIGSFNLGVNLTKIAGK